MTSLSKSILIQKVREFGKYRKLQSKSVNIFYHYSIILSVYFNSLMALLLSLSYAFTYPFLYFSILIPLDRKLKVMGGAVLQLWN